MNLPLKWEFPGGKIDPGESPEELRTLDWAAADVPVLSAYLAARRKDAP